MIVVGIDGSAASLAALRWAVDEAARRAQRVLAVMTHQPPGQVPYDALPPNGMAAMHEETLHRLAEAVSEVDPHGVTVDQVVMPRHVVEAATEGVRDGGAGATHS